MSKVDAAKFMLQCRNWPEVALPLATHKTPERIVLKNGLRFESASVYWADIYAIFNLNIYTPTYLPVEHNDLVVDVGANIGVFTIYAASRTSNTVYAIEPSPRNFIALQQNISANHQSQIVPLRYALSDACGQEAFFNLDASQHHRLKKVMCDSENQEVSEGEYVDVPTITLEKFMDQYELSTIDFLKLDCEGAEEAIFLSTPRSYLQRVRKMALEFHDHLTQLQHDELRALLKDAGFSTSIFWDGKSVLGFIYAWRS